MTQSEAEVLILTINALGAGILMFVARVVQKIMNDLDEREFKRFMNLLDKAAMGNPFAVVVATLPNLAAVLYFLAYGFGHWWFTAGFVAWLPSRALLGLDSHTYAVAVTPLAALAFVAVAIWLFRKGMTHYARTGSQRYLSMGHRS